MVVVVIVYTFSFTKYAACTGLRDGSAWTCTSTCTYLWNLQRNNDRQWCWWWWWRWCGTGSAMEISFLTPINHDGYIRAYAGPNSASSCNLTATTAACLCLHKLQTYAHNISFTEFYRSVFCKQSDGTNRNQTRSTARPLSPTLHPHTLEGMQRVFCRISS